MMLYGSWNPNVCYAQHTVYKSTLIPLTAMVTFNKLASKTIASAQYSHTVDVKDLEESMQKVII